MNHPRMGKEVALERTAVVFNGRYRIERVLGHGGMATVYCASDLALGRTVAVKVLHRQLAADGGFLERFEREASLAASVSAHPNIVTVHDVGQDGETHFIVMEIVEGPTVARVLERQGALSVSQAVGIARQVAAALDYAHRRGLIHRDVKPGNILLDQDGTVKVADFGIALDEAASRLTLPGSVLGSASYISPEQAQGEPTGPASDMYSLGAVLYEMLTGRVPFQGEAPLAVMTQHVEREPISPHSLDPTIPHTVSAIVMRALAKRVTDRYATATEFQRTLDEALRDEKTQPLALDAAPTLFAPLQPATTALEPGPPPSRMRRQAPVYLAWAGGAGLLALATGLFAALLAGGHPTHHAHPTPAVVAKKPVTAHRSPSPTPMPAPTVTPTPMATPTPMPALGPPAPPRPAPGPAPAEGKVKGKGHLPGIPHGHGKGDHGGSKGNHGGSKGNHGGPGNGGDDNG